MMGGSDGVAALINDLYRRIGQDELLRVAFPHFNSGEARGFFMQWFGGSGAYSGDLAGGLMQRHGHRYVSPKARCVAAPPALSPRIWYGMPAYAKGGKVVCFFQRAQNFNTRSATFGFMQEANLDEGAVWPTAFALKKLKGEEGMIGALVKKAVS